LLAVCVLLGGTAAAPVPPERRQSPLYFPTTVGTKWVYQLNDGREYTEVITGVEPVLGGAVVIVGAVAPDGKARPWYRHVVSERGLLREGIVLKSDRPQWLLKFPYKFGETWETGGEQGPREPIPSEKWTHTSDGEEEVTVPAGTFRALRVTSKGHGIPGCVLPPSGPSARWYAPRVGAVKMTMGKTVWVLKEFDRGE
jgi:hypothetical protein